MQKLLTINDLMELWSVSRDTIERLIRNGDLECIRVGGSIRFKPQQIADYLDQSSSRWPV